MAQDEEDDRVRAPPRKKRRAVELTPPPVKQQRKPRDEESEPGVWSPPRLWAYLNAIYDALVTYASDSDDETLVLGENSRARGSS